MHTIISQPFPAKKEDDRSLIFDMIPSVLSNVPFHTDTSAVTRYFASAFPCHMAVHHVSPVFTPPAAYTQPHIHDDHDEINIIISPDKLIYKIQLGGDDYIVHNNASIWIPRGKLHAANVLKGSGYFIALRVN